MIAKLYDVLKAKQTTLGKSALEAAKPEDAAYWYGYASGVNRGLQLALNEIHTLLSDKEEADDKL